MMLCDAMLSDLALFVLFCWRELKKLIEFLALRRVVHYEEWKR
jgi:hypothetical protein